MFLFVTERKGAFGDGQNKTEKVEVEALKKIESNQSFFPELFFFASDAVLLLAKNSHANSSTCAATRAASGRPRPDQERSRVFRISEVKVFFFQWVVNVNL